MIIREFIASMGLLSTHAGMQFIQLLTDSGETKVYKVIVVK